ncbi:MAG: ABC transporter ATP-binding protein [Ignavibacteria bacterium]|nr:ABC transporter ATP-binding protein [Ignavibacteria bacterium]
MATNQYHLEIENLTKTFSRRIVFKNINYKYEKNGIYGISGFNGAGKSTLVKTIANIITPTRGVVAHINDNSLIPNDELHNYIGFLSPYIVFYEEFTAMENIFHFAKIRNVELDIDYVRSLFMQLGIEDRKNDQLKTYSSGMKQRFKLVFALAHHPKLVILDEPTSNLDEKGKESFYQIIREVSKNSIILIASNESTDLALCSSILHLEEYKK